MAAAVITGAALAIDGGVLAERTGLLAIAGIGGAAIGLIAAGAAASPDGVLPAAMPRSRARRLAIGLAIGAVAGGALITWWYGRTEGGVLGPLDYLWTTFGPYVPVEAVLAALTAAWGAGAGPVRWRE